MKFEVHNTARGQLSETDSISGALLAAYTHLVEDGEEAPVIVVEEGEPIVSFSWLPVGKGRVVRAELKHTLARRGVRP